MTYDGDTVLRTDKWNTTVVIESESGESFALGSLDLKSNLGTGTADPVTVTGTFLDGRVEELTLTPATMQPLDLTWYDLTSVEISSSRKWLLDHVTIMDTVSSQPIELNFDGLSSDRSIRILNPAL